MPLFPPSTPSGPYYYLPNGWNTAWQNAKALLGSQRANVTVIGDSITQGFGATDILVDSYYAKLRSAILGTNTLGGDFYGLIYASAIQAVFGGSAATHPLVVNGVYNTGYAAFESAYNYTIFNFGAVTNLVTCTPPYNVVGFDIVYIDSASGTWSYQVDSGTATNVTTTGPNTAAGRIVKKVSITGLTSASHTIQITSPAGGGICNIIGVTAYATASTGLCFANMGWSGMGLVAGSTAQNFLNDTTAGPPDRLALYQGYQGTSAAPTSLTGLGFPSQPDLAIIAFGVNDSTQSATRANFRDALDRLVWSLRYGKGDACSIIIVPMWCPDGTLASSTSVTNQDYTTSAFTAYRDLKAAMLECAQVNSCAYVDVHGLFGRKPVTNGWVVSASDLHPTAAGHLKIANLISAIV